MQTVGEKLSEARQRQGARIQDVADSTHVRSDYLEALEENQFDRIPLSDVYKRGFIKIYARYLRLDAERLLNDYALTVKGGGNSVVSSGLQRDVVGRDDPDDNGGKGIINADAGEVGGAFPSPVQHGVRRGGGNRYWVWIVGIVVVAISIGLAWAFYFSPSSARKKAADANVVRPDLPPYTFKVVVYKDTAVTIVQRENNIKILDNKLLLAKDFRGFPLQARGTLQISSPDCANVEVIIGRNTYRSKNAFAKSFVISDDPAITGIPVGTSPSAAPVRRP